MHKPCLFVIALFFVELFIFVTLGQHIGFGVTILILLAKSILGSWLFRVLAGFTREQAQRTLLKANENSLSSEQIQKYQKLCELYSRSSSSCALASIACLIPGFVSLLAVPLCFVFTSPTMLMRILSWFSLANKANSDFVFFKNAGFWQQGNAFEEQMAKEQPKDESEFYGKANGSSGKPSYVDPNASTVSQMKARFQSNRVTQDADYEVLPDEPTTEETKNSQDKDSK